MNHVSVPNFIFLYVCVCVYFCLLNKKCKPFYITYFASSFSVSSFYFCSYHMYVVNIWTHLFGLIIVTLYLAQFLIWQQGITSLYHNQGFNTTADMLLFTYYLGAIGCLGCSCIYHTFACHSKNVSVACNAIDYLGIICNNV